MKITVKEDGSTHRITLPTSLALSRLSRTMILNAIRKNTDKETAAKQLPLTKAQLTKLFREVKRWKRKHGSWTLVEIKSGSGEEITINI